MKKIHFTQLEEIGRVAQEVVSFCGDEKIWVFKGQMGAGKTTLIKAIAATFGVEDRVSSPTFSIVNEYHGSGGEIFYHFDFYRIEDPDEVLEIGIEEYFYSGNHCWIEWAEKIPEYIPPDFILLEILVQDDESRLISLDRIVNYKRNG
ncbi:tRNA (adenosine(37)-N6)-threonylcarbamoyltransferase complex ATPase subunit type 1 TsaE [Arthrospiribacter ruber]|uniref:tRNA (Adenosine(37)-N6)-threonylcarbamoyltransferase complex ATPase subunit type 1 TsaE n=1 Tax=Arthrospiribacter ruber TaxID=2487934 RepID=A0A951M854_9BACT|nr:tRNA (adenosine(37)-N6)-threonylcarbamoyltransferase complex ATPase subunit type 1 TsaE [Arthrospiribacter ruber]MBW3467111.1 tRNA (adenosine(37)-N6)-threonylcarbamoyltransferase complex ATPase subunit type 1 TsaE [Arthrospiribacter ruber]